MPFLLIGILLLVLTIIFLRIAIRTHDHEGVVGLSYILIGALILIIFFGLLYSSYFR